VRCLVITGSEESFCAGGDISNMDDRSAPAVRARMYRSYAWTKCILTGEKPVVAAVNGAAAGAGFSLALLCDIVIVSDHAFFRAAFPGLGAAPDLGLALTLPRAVGSARAKDILLTNRRIDALKRLRSVLPSAWCPRVAPRRRPATGERTGSRTGDFFRADQDAAEQCLRTDRRFLCDRSHGAGRGLRQPGVLRRRQRPFSASAKPTSRTSDCQTR